VRRPPAAGGLDGLAHHAGVARVAGSSLRTARLRRAGRRTPLPPRPAALLGPGRVPRGARPHSHPGLLRLELRAQPGGPAGAALDPGAAPARADARARRALAAAPGRSGGRSGVPRQVLGGAAARRGPPLRLPLATRPPLVAPAFALPG